VLATPWVSNCRDNPRQVLDHFYVTYRVGRWHAASRASILRAGRPVPPFLDNLVVRTALGIDPVWRRSEEVIYELINLFAPQLAPIPIEGKPWRFRTGTADAPHPPGGGGPQAGGHLTAVDTHRDRWSDKPWNWRLSPPPHVARQIMAGILGPGGTEAAQHALRPIIDDIGMATLVAAFPGSRADVAWNLYTVATMLTDAFSDPSTPALDPLEVSYPDSPNGTLS
jgi:hypothetical protein